MKGITITGMFSVNIRALPTRSIRHGRQRFDLGLAGEVITGLQHWEPDVLLFKIYQLLICRRIDVL